MKHRVEILPSAWEDLKKIEDYYILQFDVQTALKVSDHILDTIERLEQFPDSGSATPDDWLNEQGYRMVICKRHIAIYRVISYRRYADGLHKVILPVGGINGLAWERTGGNNHMCKTEDDTFASDEDILNISKRLTRQNKEVYEVLAKQVNPHQNRVDTAKSLPEDAETKTDVKDISE